MCANYFSFAAGYSTLCPNVTVPTVNPAGLLHDKGLVKKYGGGGWAGAFGNMVDKKHMTHPLPSAQK